MRKPRRRHADRPGVLDIPPGLPFLVNLLTVSAILLVALRTTPRIYFMFWHAPTGSLSVLALFRVVWALATVYGALDLVLYYRGRRASKAVLASMLAALAAALGGIQIVSWLL